MASTMITIKSKELMVLNVNLMEDITPNINPVIEPRDKIQPRMFLLL